MKRLTLKEIKDYFAYADDEILRLFLETRDELLKIIPKCHECIKWNSISFQKTCPAGAVKESICQLSPLDDCVELSFVHGSFLEDPAKLLKGKCKYKRYIRLKDASLIRDKAISALIKTSQRFDPMRITGG